MSHYPDVIIYHHIIIYDKVYLIPRDLDSRCYLIQRHLLVTSFSANVQSSPSCQGPVPSWVQAAAGPMDGLVGKSTIVTISIYKYL